jgi:hypothetical protein
MELNILVAPTVQRGTPYNGKGEKLTVLNDLVTRKLIYNLTETALYIRVCEVDPVNLKEVERVLQFKKVPYRKVK